MEKFIVDKTIVAQFEYYQNICSLLSEFVDSAFAPPAALDKIEKWEKEKGIKLPHQYKSWLMLTESSRILSGYIEFRWPKLGSLDASDDVIIIGDVIGDGEELMISCESGKIFSFFDGEMEEYEDFDDLLTCLSGFMEHSAENYLGEDWADEFDEKYDY